MDGALIEAEILTSHLPIYLLNLAQFLGTGSVPLRCVSIYQAVKNSCYVSQELPKNLVHGALIEAEILISHSAMYFLNLTQL